MHIEKCKSINVTGISNIQIIQDTYFRTEAHNHGRKRDVGGQVFTSRRPWCSHLPSINGLTVSYFAMVSRLAIWVNIFSISEAVTLGSYETQTEMEVSR